MLSIISEIRIEIMMSTYIIVVISVTILVVGLLFGRRFDLLGHLVLHLRQIMQNQDWSLC